jgi:hypothetical protein
MHPSRQNCCPSICGDNFISVSFCFSLKMKSFGSKPSLRPKFDGALGEVSFVLEEGGEEDWQVPIF